MFWIALSIWLMICFVIMLVMYNKYYVKFKKVNKIAKDGKETIERLLRENDDLKTQLKTINFEFDEAYTRKMLLRKIQSIFTGELQFYSHDGGLEYLRVLQELLKELNEYK